MTSPPGTFFPHLHARASVAGAPADRQPRLDKDIKNDPAEAQCAWENEIRLRTDEVGTCTAELIPDQGGVLVVEGAPPEVTGPVDRFHPVAPSCWCRANDELKQNNPTRKKGFIKQRKGYKPVFINELIRHGSDVGV